MNNRSPFPPARNNPICFGAYEVDLRTGELRKSGMKIKLHGQPFAVLAMLLERPGEVVTREDLQQRLWASDTYVDFEHGLNKAINRLREALGDDADNPRYVETLPRRGYRFVGSIIQPGPVEFTATAAGTARPKDDAPAPKTRRKIWWEVGLGLAVVCALAIVVFNPTEFSARPPRVVAYRQLTSGLQLRGADACGLVLSALATDGPRVFFAEPHSPVSQVSATGGKTVEVSSPFPCFVFSDISPNKTELLGFSQSNWTLYDQPLWRLSVSSGEARRLGNFSGHAAAWSPDGQKIAYVTGDDPFGPNDIYVAHKDGGDARKLVSFPRAFVTSIRWSPDGKVLRMILSDPACSLWEISADGTNLQCTHLVPERTGEILEQSWTPDGRYSVLTVRQFGSGQTDLWVVPERRPFFSTAAKPAQLTTGAMSFSRPTPSPDGKEIFAVGGQDRGELIRYDLKRRRLEPFLSGISAEHLDFSRDGKWVTYVTFPEGILWRSKVDGSERTQLSAPPLYVALPRWSPDGTRIAFAGLAPGGRYKIYVVSSEGGRPELVAEDQNNDEVDPAWMPDGHSLIFGGFGGGVSRQKIASVVLDARRVSVIPGSEGLYSPRVSPDGRFMIALNTPGNRKLMLFDQHAQKWTVLLDGEVTNPGWPQWSTDNRDVYLRGGAPGKDESHGVSLYRLNVASRKLERVAEVDIPEGTTGMWGWMGVAPDGSPLRLRDRSIREVYALDVDLP